MKKLCVIFGGMSTENEVSCISGASVIKNLNIEKYDIFPIFIDENGTWFKVEITEENKLKMENKKQIENVFKYLKKMDVIFPVLHGLYGEDGTIQGLLELLKIPYVGCGVLASSVGMDKVYTKIIFNKAGINQTKYIYLRSYNDKYIYVDDNFNEKILDLKEILEEAGHEVVGICADGVRALELVKEEKPDLVILDVQMPKLDGLQAAKLIAHDDLAPVVLLTAYGDAETVEKAKRSHVFGYVMKPVEERNLFPALQIAVSQYRSRHEIAHRVKEMERELASRKIINRAKGLLMDYYHISDEEAYHKMQQTSMRRGILLTDVAQKVIKEIMVRKNMLS